MITYSKLGKKGNLGNQLFQIASTIGLAVTNQHEFSFLNWKYQNSFKNRLPLLLSDSTKFIDFEEQCYHHHLWNFEKENYDLSGWLQTEKYFDKELTKYYFEFSDSLVDKISKLYSKAFEKRTILISIRRGDFVNHKDYFQLPIKYYLNSVIRFFPEWESYNLIVLSDDINYCKFHFSFLKNVFFGEGLNEIEQLCLGTMCNDFIISNSTFSWWTAWLGEKSDSKIIRPFKNFDGLKSIELNDKDYYPNRWTNYNHLEDKPKLKDIVFIIQSKKNKEILEEYISNYFDVKIFQNDPEIKLEQSCYILKKDYFLPPFLIYFSYLQLNKSEVKLVVNNVVKYFIVSKKFNYKELSVQKDVGLFSSVFYFGKIEEKSKSLDIYLKKTYEIDENLDNDSKSDKISINFYAVKFLIFGGYWYSIKRYLRIKKIKLKKIVKKLLFRK